jgi:hypothetical protein
LSRRRLGGWEEPQMKTRALFAFVAVALCLAMSAGSASATGATATLSTNGSLTGVLYISGAPAGLYTVFELTDTGYVLTGTGVVGSSGNSVSAVAILYSSNPSFQVRLRTSDGLVVLAVQTPDEYWWWD